MGKRKKPIKISFMREFGLLLIIAVLLTVSFFAYKIHNDSVPAAAINLSDAEALPQRSFSVHYIDVGQGDCELIVSGYETMLIDAGEASASGKIIEYIKGLGINELTYIVATHPHSDHIGGLPAVIDAFPVKNFIAPDLAHTTKTFENMLDALERNGVEITVANAFDKFTFGDADLTILWPDGNEYDNINNYSVVIRAEYGETSFLFTGDAESEAEKGIVGIADVLEADVLKVGHHGSRTSTSNAFLKAVSPEIAVISCGQDNSYGHPHEEIVERLNKSGAKIYRTDLDGTVVIKSDGKTVDAETE